MKKNIDENSLPIENQTRSGKIFFLFFGLIILGSVFVTYYRIMIQKNYIIEAQVDCDPYEKACFIWECDPTSDVEGEKCTNDPEKDIWYYNLARRNASKIPLCDPALDENCAPMVCDPLEKDCEEIFCNEENKLEQEAECNDPLQYTLTNPPEEESEEGEEEGLEEDSEENGTEEGEDDLSGAEATCEEEDAECKNSIDQADSAIDPIETIPSE